MLVVLHQEHSSPGHIGLKLLTRGLSLDVRRPRFGDPLPATLVGHAGAVVFGGPMSANDPDDYIREEIDLVTLALREERPFLGVCLGAQMMAKALGAKVAPHPDEHVEWGYHDIVPVKDDGSGPAWPSRVFQWHKEGFELARGAVPLAKAEGSFPNQAFRYGPAAFGVQFHPEITYAMVGRWSGRNEHRLHLRGAQARNAQLEDHMRHAPGIQRWVAQFMEHWLSLGRKA